MEASLPIINRTYEVYKIIVQLNDTLTKRWRYSLGLSAENTVLDLLEQMIMAGSAPKPMKEPYLIKANANLEIIRLKLRLFLELKLANETKIFQIQSQLEEIGRMLGGWLKSAHNQ
ncbi:MAG: four helix bundle protein [Candidatus Peregrinibacteria bacterium]